MTPPSDAEQDSPLAALVSTLADGKPLDALGKARLRVLMVDQAVERGVTWAVIARVYGYPSGKSGEESCPRAQGTCPAGTEAGGEPGSARLTPVKHVNDAQRIVFHAA